MPRGRSTFTKRQKEQARQQRQKDKAERKNLRKEERPEDQLDELEQLRKHAEEQAALFQVGVEDRELNQETSSGKQPQ